MPREFARELADCPLIAMELILRMDRVRDSGFPHKIDMAAQLELLEWIRNLTDRELAMVSALAFLLSDKK